MHTSLLAKYTFFLSDFNENELFQQIFENYSNIKFCKNFFNGNKAVPRERTDRRALKHKDMKLIVAFCNSAKVTKNENCPDSGSI